MKNPLSLSPVFQLFTYQGEILEEKLLVVLTVHDKHAHEVEKGSEYHISHLTLSKYSQLFSIVTASLKQVVNLNEP